MQRILILRGTSASGVSLRPGEIAEVSDDDARILISLGKAKPYAEEVSPGVAPLPEIDPSMIETPDPLVQPRDPAPKRGKKAAE